MKIGILSFHSTPSYTRFRKLAGSLGYDVEETCVPEGVDDAFWSSVERLIREADALILPHAQVFEGGKPEWQDLLHKRIHSGLRVMFDAWGGHLEVQNRFLSLYGLAATDTRLHGPEPGIRISRSRETFRDPSLLAGVSAVEILGAVLVVARLDALPVLLAPEDDLLAVDSRSDLVAAWVGRDRPLMAVCYTEGRGAVLLVGGSLLGDPWTNEFGVSSRGITANEQFTNNLLMFLLPQSPALAATSIAPEQLVARTERNLAQFVIETLTATSAEWWYETVPETARKKAAERHELERGKFPKHAYLDLIDFRDIIRTNFKHFEASLKEVGWAGGKDAATNWLVQLNEHRKLIAHPLKAHLSGHAFSKEDLAFLSEVDARVAMLLSKRAGSRV